MILKRNFLLILFFSLIFTNTTLCQNSVAISEVIDEVKKAIASSASTLKCKIPKLKSVELSFEGVHSVGAGAEIELFVFSAGAKVERSKLQKLQLILKEPQEATAPASSQDPKLSLQIRDMIVAAAHGVCTSRATYVNLELDKLVVEINYIIEKGGEAGLSFQLLPINLSLGGEISDKAIQKVKIIYEN